MRQGDWVLVDRNNKLVPQMTVLSRDGTDYVLLGGRPPQHSASTGRVIVRQVGGRWERELYPSVFDLMWKQDPKGELK